MKIATTSKGGNTGGTNVRDPPATKLPEGTVNKINNHRGVGLREFGVLSLNDIMIMGLITSSMEGMRHAGGVRSN
mgnify:CR=1 FL=1